MKTGNQPTKGRKKAPKNKRQQKGAVAEAERETGKKVELEVEELEQDKSEQHDDYRW